MQVNVRFYGIVQGVGFRDRTRRMAKGLNLKGWVKNLRDGSVEAMIQGDPDTVDRLIQYCTSEIPNALVTDMKKRYVQEDDMDNFKIIK
jgi:Acylphosphatases